MNPALTPSEALSNSANWIAELLTGSIGTVIAILAIAAVGLAMLLGHVAMRDGARVILGCFVLFGAPIIAGALAGASRPVSAQHTSSEIYIAPPTLPPPPQPNRDPYAGASVPM